MNSPQITYGTNYIGGIGDTQSRAAWLVPITIQLVPAIVLAIGIMFMPQSPRWLMDVGRDEEAKQVIIGLRRLGPDHPLVEMEYLELKAQKVFETRVAQHDFPQYFDASGNVINARGLGLSGYKALFANRSNLKRTIVAVMIMVFQQWTGVNFSMSRSVSNIKPPS